MDNNMIFIPSLGIITSMDCIQFPITLAYSAKYVYSLVRDESIYTSKEMMVKRTLQIDSKAIIQFFHDTPSYGSSVEEIKKNYLNRYMSDNQEDDEDDDVPKKSKKNKNTEEYLKRRQEEIRNRVNNMDFREIIVNRDISEQAPIPITQSRPYQDMAAKYEDKLATNLAKLHKAVTLRSEALQHSYAPDETLGGTADDLLPELTTTDISAINRAGLANYEDKLKQDIESKTNLINNIYNFFDDKVIQRYHSRNKVMTGLITDEELKIADVVIKRQDVLDGLFLNELIFLNPAPKKK